MVRWRLAVAAAILIPLIGLLVADFTWNFGAPGIWIAPLGLLISLMASAEVLELLRTPGHRPLSWTVYGGVSLIFLSACAPMAWGLAAVPYPPGCPLGKLGWPFAATAAAVMVAFLGEMRRFENRGFENHGGAIVNLALSVFVLVYIGVPMGFAALLRQFGNNEWGMAALVSAIFVVKFSDTGAYFVGKTFGRRKMTPKLSPGKTIAGGVGGIAAAVLASWVFFQFLAPWITGDPPTPTLWWRAVLFGVVLAVVGILGDLSESLIKRDMRRKDSSSWLPGLGGVLDIMDSLLFTMPVAFVCFAAGLVGPE